MNTEKNVGNVVNIDNGSEISNHLTCKITSGKYLRFKSLQNLLSRISKCIIRNDKCNEIMNKK